MIISYEKLKLPVKTMTYSKDLELYSEFFRSSGKTPTGLIFGMYSIKKMKLFLQLFKNYLKIVK